MFCTVSKIYVRWIKAYCPMQTSSLEMLQPKLLSKVSKYNGDSSQTTALLFYFMSQISVTSPEWSSWPSKRGIRRVVGSTVRNWYVNREWTFFVYYSLRTSLISHNIGIRSNKFKTILKNKSIYCLSRLFVSRIKTREVAWSSWWNSDRFCAQTLPHATSLRCLDVVLFEACYQDVDYFISVKWESKLATNFYENLKVKAISAISLSRRRI